MRGNGSAFDLVVIATKAQHVPEALRVAAKLIEKGGPAAGILLIQNGIGTTKGGIRKCHSVNSVFIGFCNYQDDLLPCASVLPILHSTLTVTVKEVPQCLLDYRRL